MKKTDVAMIILIASTSMLIAYFVANSIIGGGNTESVKVKTAEPINSSLGDNPIDKTVFNENAINPTVEIIIGENSNQPNSQ